MNTGLVVPWGIAVDGSGVLYAANRNEYGSGNSGITEYAAGASGNVAPIRTITGTTTGITQPMDVSIDPLSGDVGMVNYDGSSCAPNNKTLAFAATANGNVAPVREIDTGCSALFSIAYDQNGVIYEGNNNSARVNIYAPNAMNVDPPVDTISGSNTQVLSPYGVAVDGSGYVYVLSSNGTDILVFAPGATGNVAPVETISGANTGLVGGLFIAVGP
jgi:hypothetical protein